MIRSTVPHSLKIVLQHYLWAIYKYYHKILSEDVIQQPAECGSAHGCSPCSAARGAPETCWVECCCAVGPNPLLIASACKDNISRLAACRSASLSSAVCRL